VPDALMATQIKEAKRDEERKLNICNVEQQSNVHMLHEFVTVCITVPLYSNAQI
jgi:hypothetical protein